MTHSTVIAQFVEAFPLNGLYVHKLYELSRLARELAKKEPALVAQFTLISDGLAALGTRWDGEPLSPHVADAVTPLIISAVKTALSEPSLGSVNALAIALNKARNYPLVSGENRRPIPPQSLS